MKQLTELLTIAASKNASDTHISVGRSPACRTNGEIVELSADVLTAEHTESFLREIIPPGKIKAFELTNDTDFALELHGVGRFRINAFRQRGSVSIVARMLNVTIPEPKALGIPDAVVKLTELKRGLVLVTGATGSGKSTTLASLFNVINESYPYHIITLEDPIEYVHSHKRSVVNQREIGGDTNSYAAALRAALRQDPDVILVGEMRDLETISTAVTAAETGHLVFSTLHTIGAANTVDRVIDVFPPHQQVQIRAQLAEVLRCVISQQLLPKRSSGRVSAMEVMFANAAIRNHIREGKTHQIPSVIQTNRKTGMITMDDAIFELWERGEIDADTALSYAVDRPALEKKVF